MKKILLAVLLPIVLLIGWNVLYHLVFWHPADEVSFPSGDIELSGTLLRPGDAGPYPAVLMLHGSGPEERNDPATRTAANALVRAGFAVLFYDKRGSGASGGDFAAASYPDFINDALAGLDWLAGRPDIDGRRLGLYTVSESGWFGPEIAVRNGNVRFIWGKVASPLPWIDTVLWEVRNDALADGVSPADLPALLEHTRRRWQYYLDAAADPTLASGPRRDAIEAEHARLHAEVPGVAETMSAEVAEYDPQLYARFSIEIGYDPGPWLEQLDIPVHVAYGGRDINVPSRAAMAWYEDYQARTGREVGIAWYPEAGHSLLSWRGLLNHGFEPGYLDTLVAFARRHGNIDE